MEKHFIITIGRQLGSGGRIIGQRIAKDLGIKFFDKEILDLAAKESGFSKKLFERNDEHKGFMKILSGSFTFFSAESDPYNNQLSDESLFKFQSDAIQKAAAQESCVFVGRCADYILRQHPNAIHIFITADMDDRASRISNLLGISKEEAKKKCITGDKSRAEYYNYYTAKKWGNAPSYDLCINSSKLGIEKTVEIIENYIKKK